MPQRLSLTIASINRSRPSSPNCRVKNSPPVESQARRYAAIAVLSSSSAMTVPHTHYLSSRALNLAPDSSFYVRRNANARQFPFDLGSFSENYPCPAAVPIPKEREAPTPRPKDACQYATMRSCTHRVLELGVMGGACKPYQRPGDGSGTPWLKEKHAYGTSGSETS